MKNNLSSPLISIIIPVYNCQDFVQQCIESIANQTYKNIEIIAVDDGSHDQSGKILDELAQKDVRITVLHTENRGLAAARNLGMSKGRGEYLFLVDSDDFLNPDCIKYYYSLIQSTGAQIAIAPPHKSRGESAPSQKTEHIQIISGKDAMLKMLYYRITISVWGKLFSRKLIDDHNIKANEKIGYGEGFSFSIECFQQAKQVAVGNQELYNYRINNPNSNMTKFQPKLVIDSIKAQKYIQSVVTDKNRQTRAALDYAYWHTCCDCLNTIIGAHVIKENKDMYHMLINECRKTTLQNLVKPIPIVDKIKSLLYFISPVLAAKFINRLRKRKFTTVSQ